MIETVKIRISYEHQEELEKVLKLLEPVIQKWRKAGQQEGKFLKAYIDLK